MTTPLSQFDIQGDFAYMVADLGEPVLFTSSRKAGDQTRQTFNAIRRMITKTEKSPSDGVYLGYEVNWLIGTSDMTNGPAKPGDIVTDRSKTQWTVLRVDNAAQSVGATTGTVHPMFYRCGCVNFVLALDLRDAVSVEQATIDYDATQARTSAPWTTLDGYDHLPARCQPIESTEYGKLDIDGHKIGYEVILGKQTLGDDIPDQQWGHYRLVWHRIGGDVYLEISGVRNIGLIDQLPVITANLNP